MAGYPALNQRKDGMTFTTKKTKKPGKLLSIVALTVLLVGCWSKDSTLDNYSKLLTAYIENSNKQTLNNLKAGYVDVGYIGREGLFDGEERVRERRRRWWGLQAYTQRVVISDAQWEALSFLYKEGMEATYEAEELLFLKYKGNDPELLEAAGFGAYRKGELYQAYKAFEGAALSDASKATLPRGFAFHYGCADLYQVWGELRASQRTFEGLAIPLSEPKLSSRELVEARMQLRKGIAPEIHESCPIKPVES